MKTAKAQLLLSTEIDLMNGAKSLNTTCVPLSPAVELSPLTKR